MTRQQLIDYGIVLSDAEEKMEAEIARERRANLQTPLF